MTQQDRGIVGRAVGGMIRRSVRRSFRHVRWRPPLRTPQPPCVFYANHHGWFDGYLMYCAVTRLGVPCLDWIQEYDTFPLFGHVGGLPFPKDKPEVRAGTIRKTMRAMREGTSLILFAEGKLHYPPEVLPFGRAFDLVARSVPHASLIPVAIRYEHALHERPEAYLAFGEPLGSDRTRTRAREVLADLLDDLACDIRRGAPFETLCPGTPSINERWSWKRP